MTEWIKASERVPDTERTVYVLKLSKSKVLTTCHGYYSKTFKTWVCAGGQNVRYWMDVPEVPEELKAYGEVK